MGTTCGSAQRLRSQPYVQLVTRGEPQRGARALLGAKWPVASLGRLSCTAPARQVLGARELDCRHIPCSRAICSSLRPGKSQQPTRNQRHQAVAGTCAAGCSHLSCRRRGRVVGREMWESRRQWTARQCDCGTLQAPAPSLCAHEQRRERGRRRRWQQHADASWAVWPQRAQAHWRSDPLPASQGRSVGSSSTWQSPRRFHAGGGAGGWAGSRQLRHAGVESTATLMLLTAQ